MHRFHIVKQIFYMRVFIVLLLLSCMKAADKHGKTVLNEHYTSKVPASASDEKSAEMTACNFGATSALFSPQIYLPVCNIIFVG